MMRIWTVHCKVAVCTLSIAQGIGSTTGSSAHAVMLDRFWIDQIEVADVQCCQCMVQGASWAATRCDLGKPTYGDASKADCPAVCVRWYEAQAYSVNGHGRVCP